MKAIHTAQTNQPKLNPVKKENASVSSGPVPVVSSARSHPSFALRCANKLKEFFGLFSIILPQTQRGGTSKYISRLRKLRIVGSFASIMLVFISTGIIIPYYIKTNNSEATAGQAIGSTLTFSAESLTASVSLSNLAKDGTFATSGSDEQAEFSIATDNFTGYTLTMRSTSGNTLSGSEGNTDTFTSIQSNISASTFSNTNNTTYNNQWGIIPNYYYSNNATIANTDTYLKVPATNESITLDVTSAKNAEAKNYTIGIGARADYTNKIDTYSNTFILEYIANPVTYSITYNANAGSDTVTNMPTTNPQTGSTSAGEAVSIPLYTNIPERIGYTFKGWCSVSTSDDTCSSTIYNDQTVESGNRIMNYGIDQTIDNTTVTLNAMWSANLYTCTKQYQLQAADGTFPGTYTADGTEQVKYGDTCTYSKTLADYKGSADAGNSTAATISNTMGVDGLILSLDMYRDTYMLTMSKNNTYISSTTPATGTSTRRWGEQIAISATASSGNEFTTWSQTAGTGNGTATNFASSLATNSNTFTMPTSAATVYAEGKSSISTLTFTAGSNIDLIIVADGSNKYKPYYATTGNSVTFENKTAGTNLIVTVVPKANYRLSSWSGDTANLASTTLLSTTYTVPSGSATMTATGTNGTYTTMKNFTNASCTTAGSNVTDERNGISYTVAKIGSYCYMLSNLRLAGGTTLSTSTSHVSSSYTLPSNTGNSGWISDYCKPYMATKNNEYYYNWPAATARTNSTSSTSDSAGCSNDLSNSKGDICPYNWSLPTYDSDVTATNAWNNGANPAMLSATGYFFAGSQISVGSVGIWWSSTRYDKNYAYRLDFNGTSASRTSNLKHVGYSVRCMRSS